MALIEHLEKLRYFLKLSNHRSINEGAKAMGLSQAGLSKSLASLEEALETKLFIRSPEGLILTKEGALVLSVAKQIVSEAESLEAHLRSFKAPKTPRQFRIGMYDSIAVYFFSDLLSYIKTIYQSVDIQLTVDTSSRLATAMTMGEVDLAIGVNLDQKKAKNCEFFLLFEDHYSFYLSTKIENEISKLPLLLHPHADDLQGLNVERHLAELIKVKGAHRIFNFETLKTLTLQGFGIGVLPTKVAEPLLQQKQLVSVQVPKTRHLFGLHNIGFLATDKFLKTHREFAEDIYRLGQRWSKSR